MMEYPTHCGTVSPLPNCRRNVFLHHAIWHIALHPMAMPLLRVPSCDSVGALSVMHDICKVLATRLPLPCCGAHYDSVAAAHTLPLNGKAYIHIASASEASWMQPHGVVTARESLLRNGRMHPSASGRHHFIFMLVRSLPSCFLKASTLQAVSCRSKLIPKTHQGFFSARISSSEKLEKSKNSASISA